MQVYMSGNLVIKPLSANLTRDTEWFFKMDPYVKLFVGSHVFKTNVHHSGGKHPSWQNVFNIHRTTEPDIKIFVYDHETFSHDDYVCEGVFNLSQICNPGGGRYADHINLHYKGKPSGTIYMEIQFFPDQPGGMGMNPQMMNMGMGMNPQMNMNQGMGMGINPQMNMNMNPGMNPQMNMNMNMNPGMNPQMNMNPAMNPQMNMNPAMNPQMNMNMGMGMGMNPQMMNAGMNYQRKKKHHKKDKNLGILGMVGMIMNGLAQEIPGPNPFQMFGDNDFGHHHHHKHHHY